MGMEVGFYTKAEVAAFYGVSGRTVMKWSAQGRIPKPIKAPKGNAARNKRLWSKAIIDKDLSYRGIPVARQPLVESATEELRNRADKLEKLLCVVMSHFKGVEV